MRLASLLLSTAMFVSNPGKTQNLAFNGSVQHGESFSKKLPNGLIFGLESTDCGWTVDIHPPGNSSVDYVWPENPPVHEKNELFLDDEYDGNWKSPLQHVHTIYFARNAQQAKQELDWIDAFERGDYREAENLDLPRSELGELNLQILTYGKTKVETKSVANAKDHWCATDMHFHVRVSRW